MLKHFIRLALLLILVLAFSGLNAQLQVENFAYSIANKVVVSPKVLEFDLVLLNLNNTKPFEIATVQAGVTLNPAFAKGGKVTASIVPGSSTLSNSAQWPANVTYVMGITHAIKLASRVPPGAGSGSIMSTDPRKPTRICRIRLTNTVNWAAGALDNLMFCYARKPYPTKISEYLSGVNVAVEIGLAQDFKSAFSVEENKLSGVTISSELNILVIKNTTGLPGEVWIYDPKGQELQHTTMTSEMETRIPVKVPVGAYFIKVITEKGAVKEKVFFR